MRDYTIRKCNRCCPDGGAICDSERNIDGKPIWKCRNCYLEMPRRIIKATGKPTPTQAALIERLTATFGGTVETEMIGRKAYVKLTNEARPWYAGRFLGGIIGAGGKFKLNLYKLGGDVEITTEIGIKVYLQR